MMHRITAIALNTYREASRARIFLGLIAVALATIGYSIVIGAYTLGSAPRTVSDLGAASISVYALVTAIILAATGLHRELAYKTVFPILARPVRRGEFIVGKYLGHLLTLLVFIALDGAFVLLTLSVMAGRSAVVVTGLAVVATTALIIIVWKFPKYGTFAPIPWALGMFFLGLWLAEPKPDEMRVVSVTCLLTLLEVAIVLGITTVFASFSSPFLTAMLTLGLVIVGRQADSLAQLPVKVFGNVGYEAGVFLSKIVPNLHVYVPARPLLTGEAVAAPLGSYLALASVQSVAWSAGLLVVATIIFYKRDFL